MVEELGPLLVQRRKVGAKPLVDVLEKIGRVIPIDTKIMPQPSRWMELGQRYAVFLSQ